MIGSRRTVGVAVVAAIVAASVFLSFTAPQHIAVMAPEVLAPTINSSDAAVVAANNRVSSVVSEPIVDGVSSAASGCLLRYFEMKSGMDYNQGARYDTGLLQRGQKGTNAADSCDRHCLPHDTAMVSDFISAGDGRDDLEPMSCFLHRCMEACIAVLDNVCTGFVIRGSTCYLKRYVPVFVAREPSLTTFLRRPELAGPKFLSDNYAVDDSLRTRIVFGVLAAAQLAPERLVPALNTWLCDVDKVVFLEDNAAARQLEVSMRNASERSHVYVRPACWHGLVFEYHEEPADAVIRSFNGAWKNFPLLRSLARSYGGRLWFSIVDDDSFVVQHNLNVLLTSIMSRLLNPRTDAISLGVVYTDGKTHFTQGGAGIFLTRAAMFNMLENYHTCFDKCRQWAGDIRLGCCYPLAAVEMVSLPVFSSQDVLHVMREGPPSMLFPVTFHQLKTRSFIVGAYNAEQLSLGQPIVELPPFASPDGVIKTADRVRCNTVQSVRTGNATPGVRQCSLSPFTSSARSPCRGVAAPVWWYHYERVMDAHGCALA